MKKPIIFQNIITNQVLFAVDTTFSKRNNVSIEIEKARSQQTKNTPINCLCYCPKSLNYFMKSA